MDAGRCGVDKIMGDGVITFGGVQTAPRAADCPCQVAYPTTPSCPCPTLMTPLLIFTSPGARSPRPPVPRPKSYETYDHRFLS